MMRLLPSHLSLLLVLAAAAAAAAVAAVAAVGAQASAVGDGESDLPQRELVVDESHKLSEEELARIVRDFGQHIKATMEDEMGRLIETVEKKSKDGREKRSRVNEDELERFRAAKMAISEDAQARIELAAKKNRGELTQSSADDLGQGNKLSFLSQVSGKLRSAGSYIGQQMGALVGLAPRIKDKLKTVPSRLRRLLQWPNFLRYKVRFNKVYKSLREELYRQMIYLHKQTIVAIQNLKYLTGSQTHLLKATQYADITEKEFQQMYLNLDAESGKRPLDDEGFQLQAKDVAKMKGLAAEGRNVFGQNMEQVMEEAKRRQEASDGKSGRRRRRRRRDVLSTSNELEMADEEEEWSDGELDDPMMVTDAERLRNDLEQEEEEEEEARLVDSYAAGLSDDAKLEDMDDIEDLMDEALGEHKAHFKPVDLRDTKCVATPENQNGCGACYAYVTTMAASYFNCMQNGGQFERYNSRFLSDCGRYMWPEGSEIHIEGCKSGKLSYVVSFARLAGTYSFMKYEVARVSNNYSSDQCAYPRPPQVQEWAPVQLDWFKRTKLVYLFTLEDVDLHLRTIGPVFVNVRTWKNFSDQGSGIYNELEDSTNPIIHSMMIVGHGRERGRDYYIIWNSHGTAWGEHGYVRIYAESLEHFKVFYAGYLEVGNQ